ncbi:MAG: hypothetical protein V1860_00180 [bacterium]
MKIFIPETIKSPTRSVLQKLGYFENYDHRTGKISYIKRLSREMFYPRFHVYIDETQTRRIINLHLDQKKPSYAGASAHNAEYDSDVVHREGKRMEEILMNMESAPINSQEKYTEKKPTLWEKIKGMFLR